MEKARELTTPAGGDGLPTKTPPASVSNFHSRRQQPMVKIPDYQDPTLAAVDKALEDSQERRDSNGIGMGSIGGECERQIWFDFRWMSDVYHNALSLKRFKDGHLVEDLMAKRLRLVDGITLITIDPDTGRQYRVEDFGGHFSGYIDGAALGVIQAPKTWHVWDHKSSDQKKVAKLTSLKATVGEKNALKAWNSNYYAQAILYMHYTGMERHYLTVSAPGGRDSHEAVRTNADPVEALRLVAKAKRIFSSDHPPAGVSEDPSFWLCKWCSHARACHDGETMRATCRSCLHATPEDDGSWSCARWGKSLSYDEQQEGCEAHLFIPDLIKGKQLDAGPDWVSYGMPNGNVWVDGAKPTVTVGEIIERRSDQACRNCGSVRFIIEEGKGPHAAHLRCEGCSRGGVWLSKTEAMWRSSAC